MFRARAHVVEHTMSLLPVDGICVLSDEKRVKGFGRKSRKTGKPIWFRLQSGVGEVKFVDALEYTEFRYR